MSFLEDVFGTINKVVQKPQSIAMGMFNEASGQADDLRDFMRQYEYALVDDTPENAAKYAEAQRIVGSSEAPQGASGVGALVNPSQLIAGAVQGAKTNVTPSDMLMQEGLNNPVLNVAADVLIDPTLALGGVGSKAPGAAGKLAQSATTFGKLGEGAGKADKAAQAARYLYQGMLAGGGDPLLGAGIAGIMPAGERVVGKLAGKLVSRAGTEIADDLVGQGTEKAMSRTGLDKLEADYQDALRVLGRDMPDAPLARPGVPVEGPGFTMQTRGGAVEPFRGTGDPMADRARAYLAFNPQADAGDILFDVAGTGMSDAQRILERAKSGVDKSSIPLSDRGALFNKKLMDDLGWEGQLTDTWAQPALGPAPVATPMPATTSQALERFTPELGPLPIQPAPTAYGAMNIQQFGPKPSALGAAPTPFEMPAAPPVGASSPYVRGSGVDVEVLKQALNDALLRAEKAKQGGSLALNRGMSAEEELLLKLAGGL